MKPLRQQIADAITANGLASDYIAALIADTVLRVVGNGTIKALEEENARLKAALEKDTSRYHLTCDNFPKGLASMDEIEEFRTILGICLNLHGHEVRRLCNTAEAYWKQIALLRESRDALAFAERCISQDRGPGEKDDELLLILLCQF